MTIERLRGIDAAFLYLETPSQHMHVTATMLFEPAPLHLPGGAAPDAAMVAAVMADRLAHRLAADPSFRRRLAAAPLAMAHPAWVDATDFDVDDHVRLVTLPVPGSREQLREEVGRIAQVPLDRRRPLWELTAIAGVEGGLVAVVLKVHHAMVDGVSGVELFARLFVDACLQEPKGAPPVAVPSPFALVASAGVAALTLPGRVYRTVTRTLGVLGPAVRAALGSVAAPAPTLPFSAPRTALNRALTAERRVAFGRVPLADIKEVKTAFAVTVNDVVLGACALALGEYLREKGEDPQQPLVASVPVSEHGADDAAAPNRVSVMFVGLPVHLREAGEVLSFVHAGAAGAKRLHGALGRAMLAEWAELAPPAILTAAAGLYSRWQLADRLPPPHSVVISNVPGPPFTLTTEEARLVAAYPIGPVLEGAGINISVLSYVDTVHVGLVTCPRTVPDPAELARGIERAVAAMLDAARRLGTAPEAARA